ncbi:hypothetical protein [Endozoicomonas acroporae]|uniref:hypothetical protein n=1 Tax=Endozoicomonas acroporae TaxID=1701104 RepID=UPI0013D0DBF2|nr:hypothetical protein [Endozoicomonas acroporae]
MGLSTRSFNLAIHRCAPFNGATVKGCSGSDACRSIVISGFDRAVQRCGVCNDAVKTFNRSRSDTGIGPHTRFARIAGSDIAAHCRRAVNSAISNISRANTRIGIFLPCFDVTILCHGISNSSTLLNLPTPDTRAGTATGCCNIAVHRCGASHGATFKPSPADADKTFISRCCHYAVHCRGVSNIGLDRISPADTRTAAITRSCHRAVQCPGVGNFSTGNSSRSNSGICTLAHCFNVAENRSRVGNSSICKIA